MTKESLKVGFSNLVTGVQALEERDGKLSVLCGEMLATLNIQQNRDSIASGRKEVMDRLWDTVDGWDLRYRKIVGDSR